MKKCMSFVLVMMLGSAATLPLRADTGGAVPNTPASKAKIPKDSAALTDMSGAPKLVVEFQSSHADIPASFTKNIKAFGKYLQDNPGSLAEIAGYADHTGSNPANGALASKRAMAVKEFLVTECAVASHRITAEGYGEVSTKANNSTEAGKQTNRSAIGTIITPKS